MSYHLPVIIFLIPFLTAVCMPMVGGKNRDWCRPMALAAVFAMCFTAVLNLWGVLVVLDHGETPDRYFFGGWPISTSLPAPPIRIEWVNDPFSSVMLVALSFLASLCLIYGGPVLPQSLGKRVVHYYTLILLLISGLTGIVFAGDIFNIFVFLEVAALSAYALVAVPGGRALVAAFRYLILGTLGASFYLLGVVFLYAATGTLNMADLAEQLTDNDSKLMTSKTIIAGSTFMFIGLGIKMALFPLHGWLPGAYTRAPDAISPILAALMTKVALYAWVRIMFWVLGARAELGQVHLLALLGVLGAIAAVVGALLALGQQDVKRMFAYGGISHIGLILIGVSQGNQTGFAGGMFYLINDAVMQASAFFIAGAAVYQHGARTVDEWASLRGSPWMTGALIILAMSMIGIPPTGGFFGKWYIILGAIEAGNYLAVGAVVVATLLTMAYFQRLFISIFRDLQTSSSTVRVETHRSLRVSVGVTSVAIIVLGLCSDPIIKLFRNVAESVGLVNS
jgi:multicomponent Na+:H+ antiporter subunit D